LSAFDKTIGMIQGSGSHTQRSSREDMLKVLQQLTEKSVFQNIGSRFHQNFHKPTKLGNFDDTILDYLISELASRFNEDTKKASLVQHLLLSKMKPSSSVEDIQEVVDLYHDDLPNSSIVDEEYERWKTKLMSVGIEKRPQSISEAMNIVVHKAFQIFLPC